MSRNKDRDTGLALAGALIAGVTSTGAVWGAGSASPPQDVATQIQALKEKIDQLEAQQKSDAQARSEAESQATLKQVLEDADRHSQFMDATGFTGGWNKAKQQFFLGSEDGNFYFHPGVIAQIRGDLAYRDHGKKTNTSDTQTGFEIRRAKFYFDGNLFTPDLTYRVQWQDSVAGGAPALEYAWAQYVLAHKVIGAGDFAIKAGQTKDIVFKETFTGDTFQLMAERSLAESLVGGNQPPNNLIQGVDFLWLGKNNPLHAEVEIHNGFGTGNTTFGQPHGGTPVTFPQTAVDPLTNPAYFGVSTRADYKVFGDWADTTDFTGVNSGKKDLLDLGAGLDYTDSQGAEALRYTVDAQYQLAKKITIFAAGYGNNFTYRGTKALSKVAADNYGAVVEGGYLLDPAIQLVARYSLSKFDHNFKVGGWGTFQEIGAGFNWFGPHGEWGNHARFTMDVNYLPDGTPAVGGEDYLASTGRHEEIVLRTQFQVWF